jgi:osmotically-inducible protein OsmY
MIRTNSKTRAALITAVVSGALLSVPQISMAARASGAVAQQENSGSSDAAAKLNKSQFKNVKVTVDNGVATLTGTVDLYENKVDAGKRVLKAKGVSAVRNLIEVAGPTVPDSELENKLRAKLSYELVGFGIEFDAIGVTAHNGVIEVGGNAHTPWNRDSALAIIGTTPGVKDVVGNIEVDPESPMDDQIRIATARAIYGYPSLQKYMIDPAKPIRISVQNGNVELFGRVDSTVDKETAEARAKSVPDVFSVKDYLQVASQQNEKQ